MNPGDTIIGYEIIELINEGRFCRAYKASERGDLFFLKEYFPFENELETKQFKENQDQIATSLVGCPNCEKIIKTSISEGRIIQVKQFIEGQDLEKKLEGVDSAKEILEYMIKLVKIIDAIHKRGIVHSDLKPQQFMVENGSNSLFLVDFDWSFPDGRQLKTVGTSPYQSPEHFSGNEIGFASDIFTTGIILYESLTRGGHPYLKEGAIIEEGKTLREAYRNPILSPSLNQATNFWTKELSDVITCMVNVESTRRPGLSEVVDALKKERDVHFPNIPISMSLKVENTGDYCYFMESCIFDKDCIKKYFLNTRDAEGELIEVYWNKNRKPMFKIFRDRDIGWFAEDGLGTTNWIKINGNKLIGRTSIKNGDLFTLIYERTQGAIVTFTAII